MVFIGNSNMKLFTFANKYHHLAYSNSCVFWLKLTHH